MITVEQAEQIIMQQRAVYGSEVIPFDHAAGRILAADIMADRDMPACNRATMDGIAISYAAWTQGIRQYTIKATIAAGHTPTNTDALNECAEIMTGAPVPDTLDTVIRYEDLVTDGATTTVTTQTIKQGQNVHKKGRDRKAGDVIARKGMKTDAPIVSTAASAGIELLQVSKLPKAVIITTGDELVPVKAQPNDYQVRSSNNHTLHAALQQYGLYCDMLHLRDDKAATETAIKEAKDKYDVLLLTGGVSMGLHDHVPAALIAADVEPLFHKVQQRPGKPFWFGRHAGGPIVFAFPGNPVSSFMCLHRYFIPWLQQATGAAPARKTYAVLGSDVTFAPDLQYFLQVWVTVSEQGMLTAAPVEGNGSGDLSNLADSNAFMELPKGKNDYKAGEVYRIWPFKQIT